MNQATKDMIAAIVRETTVETIKVMGALNTPIKAPVSTPVDLSILSETELKILSLVCTGASNAQIADKVGSTMETVKNHVNQLTNKLARDLGEFPNRTSLAYLAAKNGL